MHIYYLRIVDESGDPIVEQASEAGFHLETIGLESGAVIDASDNPDTVGKPQSINCSLCFINVNHLSLMPVALK
jgi:hypothetical protein